MSSSRTKLTEAYLTVKSAVDGGIIFRRRLFDEFKVRYPEPDELPASLFDRLLNTLILVGGASFTEIPISYDPVAEADQLIEKLTR